MLSTIHILMNVFGAELFVPIEAQVLRPPGAYITYVTKGAKAATKSGAKRSSQKGCLGLYGQVNKRIRWMPRR
jgi:hypothetical protein